MNGVSLLLTLASLGPVYSPRTGLDQQQEYVLQVEPEVVQALLEVRPGRPPEEIFSDVPADAGTFQRLCIAILPKDTSPVRHTAAGEEQFRSLILSAGRYASRTPVASDAQPMIFWPARAGASPDQTNGITTGWEPDAQGNPQYIVQIEPTLLSTLGIGDELYIPVDPAAGRIVRFIVKAGREPLPHVGGQPSALGQAPIVQRPSRYNTGMSDSPAGESRAPRWNQPPGYSPPNGPNYTAQNPVAPPNTNFEGYRGSTMTDGETSLPPLYAPPPANQQPQFPPAPRYAPQYPEARVAGRTPAAITPPLNPANPGAYPPSTIAPQQPDKPWGPLLFVTFALFFSIGGNLYLAYTALEFHSRYRNAIERLRSAARST